MADVKSCAEALTAKISWQQGDMALIDNHRILHGRNQTDGGARSILVRMGAPTFALAPVA
jgi:alpha-ketoglutarate-dependent taurine dioxygenase